ncbi:MAG: transketolase family protein [Oscillospiraceae bacterium]
MMEHKRIATRESYGRALVELGEKNDKIVVLDADLAASTKTAMFQKAFPLRHFDCGIAEANMMSIAAGMAAAGMIPFASSFAMFAAGRAFEQVRNSIGYPHLNVKIGATHAGISVGEDGATHQCNEDIALMRSIPGMIIINPADDVEARAAVHAAANYSGPVYLRFGRLGVPTIYDEKSYHFEIGKAMRLREGKDVSIIATGLMVERALQAAELLNSEGISARVINIHTIKPIDRAEIIAAARDTGAIVTAEEHSVVGGLYSAVSEVLCAEYPCKAAPIAIMDLFGQSGTAMELLEYYGLTALNIATTAKELLHK